MKKNLIEVLKEDLISALKARKQEEVLVLRGILAAVHNEQIRIGKDKELTEKMLLNVLVEEAKKRKEAIGFYRQGRRKDKTEAEERELKIIEKYLPKQLTDEELAKIVKETIKEIGAESIGQIGQVMGHVMQKIRGQADGKKVKEMVEKELKD